MVVPPPTRRLPGRGVVTADGLFVDIIAAREHPIVEAALLRRLAVRHRQADEAEAGCSYFHYSSAEVGFQTLLELCG